MKRAILAVTVLLLAAVAAWAQGPGAPATSAAPVPPVPPAPGASGMPAMMIVSISPLQAVRVPTMPVLARMEDQLGLSEDQKAKVSAAYDKHLQVSRPLTESYTQSIRGLQTAVKGTKFDAAAVKAAATKALKAEESLISASTDFWATFRGILTAEQNQKFAEMAMRPGPPIPGRPDVARPGAPGPIPPPPPIPEGK